jgi:molecular chaperone GrpE
MAREPTDAAPPDDVPGAADPTTDTPPAATAGNGADAHASVATDAGPDAPTAAAAEPTAESLAAERDAARQQAQDYLAMAQRAQADFQNFRRRAEQERTEAFDRGRGEVVNAILPVLDDFERALAALPAERQTEDWLEGVRLIERKLRSTLESLGVERIEAEGQPFDPWQHEAVLHEERGDFAPGTVAAVARHGYRLGGKVLRPAQVVVAKEP